MGAPAPRPSLFTVPNGYDDEGNLRYRADENAPDPVDETEVTIDGQPYIRIGPLDRPGIAVSEALLPEVVRLAVWDGVYGNKLRREDFSALQRGSYRGSNFFFADPLLHLIAPNVEQPKIAQETAFYWAPTVAAVVLTAGAASGAFAGVTVGSEVAVSSAIVTAGEGAVIAEVPAALELAPAGASTWGAAAPESGPLMFSGEQAAIEAFTFIDPVITPAAGELGGPALFSAEHAASGAFGGEFFAAPAAGVTLPSLTTLQSAVKPALALGRAARSLLTGKKPKANPLGGTMPMGGEPGGASVESDIAWTLGTLAVVFALFKSARY